MPTKQTRTTKPRKTKKPKSPYTFDIKKVAKQIDWAIDDWKGQCYGVAMALVENGVLKGKAIYGHYTGYIDPDGYFKPNAGLGWAQHGWVLTDDGFIVDATRWVFESTKPYIYVSEAPDKDYDEGGNQFRTATLRPPPGTDPTTADDKWIDLDFSKYEESAECREKVLELLQRKDLAGDDASVSVTPAEMHWLANVPYDLFRDKTAGMDLAPNIFKAIADKGHRVHIPLDNYQRAKRIGASLRILLR